MKLLGEEAEEELSGLEGRIERFERKLAELEAQEKRIESYISQKFPSFR